MGLTGHILEVEFRMKRIPSPWLVVETERISGIDAFMDGLKDGGARLAADQGLDRLPEARAGSWAGACSFAAAGPSPARRRPGSRGTGPAPRCPSSSPSPW